MLVVRLCWQSVGGCCSDARMLGHCALWMQLYFLSCPNFGVTCMKCRRVRTLPPSWQARCFPQTLLRSRGGLCLRWWCPLAARGWPQGCRRHAPCVAPPKTLRSLALKRARGMARIATAASAPRSGVATPSQCAPPNSVKLMRQGM